MRRVWFRNPENLDSDSGLPLKFLGLSFKLSPFTKVESPGDLAWRFSSALADPVITSQSCPGHGSSETQ